MLPRPMYTHHLLVVLVALVGFSYGQFALCWPRYEDEATDWPLKGAPIPPNDTGLVLDSQTVPGPLFIGEPAEPQQLAAKTLFSPDAITYHADAGNCRVNDWQAPIGREPRVKSRSIGLSAQYFHKDGRLTARIICEGDNGYHYCLAALNPKTLETLASWSPRNETLLSPYGMVTEHFVLMPTLEGRIIEIERVDNTTGTFLRQHREINLNTVLPADFITSASVYDADGRVWFIAGRLKRTGTADDSGIIGYVATDGAIHAHRLDNQIFENSIAVNGRTVYANSGPVDLEASGAAGQMYAFQVVADGNIETVWVEQYSVDRAVKPGGLSNGSGSTPALVGDRYVAMTDNAPDRINLNIYRQVDSVMGEPSAGGSNLVCQVPIFKSNGSANENAMVGYYDGSTYSVVVNNHYAAPHIQSLDTIDDINGSFNNFTSLAAGMTRIDILEDGKCVVLWDTPIRSTSVLSFSTANGLLYSYTQDDELSPQGEYVWYFTAIDFASGKVVWRVRAGAGGAFNNNLAPTQLSPSGALWQIVLGGVTWLEG
ncbi:unnamed protein product [Clonostachys byssicola]|uniref:Uncharacterized protein n=1 Tax=Clonostachys byssicola TaxID=160290 RepID=A0A9N9UN79_9HYPO|nr:unnamed protein product [Clonostachys byssicola]